MTQRPDWEDADWGDADREDDSSEDFAERKFTISPAGREVMGVINAIEAWLAKGPGQRLRLTEGLEAQVPMRLFLDGWNAGVLHALAPGPLTLEQLSLALDTLSRSSLREMLAKMRDAGLLEARPGNGEGDAYAVTEWLRERSARSPSRCAANCARPARRSVHRRHAASRPPSSSPCRC